MRSPVASARRDTDGNPAWTFRVTDALLQDNRRVAFPKEVAAQLGCKPGALTRVVVEDPMGCRKLTVFLEESDPQRTVVLSIAEPLKNIGARSEQSVDLVITGRRRVALRLNGASRNREPTAEPLHFDAPADDLPSIASSDPPAPWGSPPTSLLPRWYLVSHGHKALPREFTSAYPATRHVRDLERFWEHYDEPVRAESAWTLRDMAMRMLPPEGLKVLPPHLDVDELDRLPLANRTRNCLRAGLANGALAEATLGQLMRLPSFGIASLLDLMCVLEAAEDFEWPAAAVGTAQTAEASAHAEVTFQHRTIPEAVLQSDAVELIATAATEFRGATTFGDLLRLDLSDLIAAAEADAGLDDLPLGIDAPTVTDRAVEMVSATLAQMTDIERLAVLGRVASDSPMTLAELAERAGLSRERIRQIVRKAQEKLEDAAGPALRILELIAHQRLGEVTTVLKTETATTELLPQPEGEVAQQALLVARRMLGAMLGYECREGLCLSPAAVEAAEALKGAVDELVDDAGLISTDRLQSALAPEWHDHSELFTRWIGWHRLFDHVAPRATVRARVKAALFKIGSPATKAELAQESSLSEQQVAGALSNIPSVARADKHRWGLREWIDDIYEGIPAEIVQRINEDGGSTRLNRLLDEIPRLFGVTEGSVWAYLNTPAFCVEHGWVSEATQSDIQLGRLDDVISGHDETGDPYYTFQAYDRYLDGYSLQGVPPEVAAALGCEFGSRSTARVRSPEGAQDISVIWRKTSMHGPEIGRLGPALHALRAREGTPISLIIHNAAEVSFGVGAAGDWRAAESEALFESPHTAASSHADTGPARTLGGVQVAGPLRARFSYKLDSSDNLPSDQRAHSSPTLRRVPKE